MKIPSTVSVDIEAQHWHKYSRSPCQQIDHQHKLIHIIWLSLLVPCFDIFISSSSQGYSLLAKSYKQFTKSSKRELTFVYFNVCLYSRKSPPFTKRPNNWLKKLYLCVWSTQNPCWDFCTKEILEHSCSFFVFLFLLSLCCEWKTTRD